MQAINHCKYKINNTLPAFLPIAQASNPATHAHGNEFGCSFKYALYLTLEKIEKTALLILCPYPSLDCVLSLAKGLLIGQMSVHFPSKEGKNFFHVLEFIHWGWVLGGKRLLIYAKLKSRLLLFIWFSSVLPSCFSHFHIKQPPLCFFMESTLNHTCFEGWRASFGVSAKILGEFVALI